jgi:peptide/nickel transport system ATP-binding protein
MTEALPLLEVENLSVRFKTRGGLLTAVNQLSFTLAAGETLAVVGESGCGKSASALAIAGLLPRQARLDGSVRLEGRQLVGMPEKEMRRLRGARVGMIFQDPMSALNPVLSIGDQLIEAILAHRRISRAAARARAVELLAQVRIPEPDLRLADFPHRLSGGLRQRVVIAMALAAHPVLLIADEPTTALDVTIQAQILQLLAGLQRELGMALLLITHDLCVVAETADRVIVMYAGRKVEEQSVNGLFAGPLHPYTHGLMRSRPHFDPTGLRPHARLHEIPGVVPALSQMPQGCAFAPRCPLAQPACALAVPPLEQQAGAGLVACIRAMELPAVFKHSAADPRTAGEAPAQRRAVLAG